MKNSLTDYSAALYIRLSKDDGYLNESSSITTQRKMLLRFAKENSFIIYDTYIDDGYSGTNFDRPAFKRMIQDIEDRKVNLVITKDLSRLGRDYISTGQYTEIYFPVNRVRYIAINDGYDSESQQNDIAPFKNVVNEMYARDISKKIKSAFLTKMQEGYFIGNFAPYGYQKDANNKNHLIPDKEAAKVIEVIFSMAEKGNRPKQIADHLNKLGVPTPLMYRNMNVSSQDEETNARKKEWTSATLSKILHNPVYIGQLEQGKTTKISIKSKTSLTVPKENRIVAYNTHEAIISEETFNMVQKFSGARKNPKNTNFINIFSGIALCMDCGKHMSTAGKNKNRTAPNLVCGRYKLYGKEGCSNHYINYEILYETIRMELQKQLIISDEEKEEIIKIVEEKKKKSCEEVFQWNKRKTMLENRIKELNHVIQKLYEDKVSGLISEERFKMLLEIYESELYTLTDEVTELKNCKKDEANRNDNIKYNKLLESYTNVAVLTPKFLNKWVEKIEIGQGYYEKSPGGSIKKQDIKIYYRFSGQDNTIILFDNQDKELSMENSMRIVDIN